MIMSAVPLILELDTVEGGADLLIADLRDAGLRANSAEDSVGKAVVRLSLSEADAASTAAVLGSLLDLRGFTGAAVRFSDGPGTERFVSELGQLITVLDSAGLTGHHGFRVAADDPAERQELIAQIARASGWHSEPSDWVINFERRVAADPGSWIAQIGPLHWSRRNGRLQRLPWSTPGALADFLVRLAKLRSGQTVLDPCCGSGTILVSAGLCGAGRLYGVDREQDSVRIARENLSAAGLTGKVRLGDWLDPHGVGADDRQLAPGTVDRVISNLPFGKQVGSHQGNRALYPVLLAEIARLLRPDGRAVLLTEDKRLFTATVQRTRGIKIVKERTFRYSGATPSAYMITRRR